MSNVLNLKQADYQPLCVETQNNIILLGNAYAKDTLSCINKEGCVFTCVNGFAAGKNQLNLSRYMNLQSSGYKTSDRRDKTFGVVSDPYIPNRYYFIVNNAYSAINSDASYLVFADETSDGKMNIINITYNDGDNFTDILDIDEDYIYIATDNVSRLYRIRKKDAVVETSIFNGNTTGVTRIKCSLLYKDDTFFHLIIGGYSYNRFVYFRYNKRDKTIINQLYSHDNLSAGNQSYSWENNEIMMGCNVFRTDNFYKEGTKYYFCSPGKRGLKFKDKDGNTLEGNANNNLHSFCVDLSKNPNKENMIEILTENSIQNVKELDYVDISSNVVHFWIVGDYLYYALYEESNTNADMRIYQGIHVIKINPGFKLEYVQKIDITNERNIMSMITNENKQLLLIGYYQAFEVFKLNNKTHLYEKLNKEISNILYAGFDTMSRIWYETVNYAVHCVNLDDPYSVTVNFEHRYYAYENQDIESYVTLQADSFTDMVPTGEYILTLDGNVCFKENSKKEITIKYTGGVAKIPIIVTGSQKLTCSVRFKKVW